MFLTVKVVTRQPGHDLCGTKIRSIEVEEVVSYRGFVKASEHQSIEGEIIKVNMKRNDGLLYFILVNESVSHFEKRVNAVLWLKQNGTATSSQMQEQLNSYLDSDVTSSENESAT